MTSGRLDQATSKAAVLQQLCDRLKFNPEAAGSLHRSLYRQKMDDVLKNHQKITGASLFVCCFPDAHARHVDGHGYVPWLRATQARCTSTDRWVAQSKPTVCLDAKDMHT